MTITELIDTPPKELSIDTGCKMTLITILAHMDEKNEFCSITKKELIEISGFSDTCLKKQCKILSKTGLINITRVNRPTGGDGPSKISINGAIAV